MIFSRVDKRNNILYINLSGKITKQEIQKKFPLVMKQCLLMRDGYSVINDMSFITSAVKNDLEVLSTASKKVSLMKKMDKIVRILPSDAGLRKSFLLVDKMFEVENTLYADNKQEALNLILDN